MDPLQNFLAFLSGGRVPWSGPPGADLIEPRTISGILNHNLSAELKAILDYRYGAQRAVELGDTETADLLNHIRLEEEHHAYELIKRLEGIT